MTFTYPASRTLAHMTNGLLGDDGVMTAPTDRPEPFRIVTMAPDGSPVDDDAAEPIDDGPGDADGVSEMVEQPAKVMRIGSMMKQLLEEVRAAPLDDASRIRLREIHESSIEELSSGLAPELREELARLSLPFTGDAIPSDAELRIAQAQLVGWLEGLFHGIQATLFAQQMAARAQLEEMRQRALPPGAGQPQQQQQQPGLYL
jgi:hypothetical protein